MYIHTYIYIQINRYERHIGDVVHLYDICVEDFSDIY
jgi:hypothetical protein